jgi:hypothetical protein
MQLISRSLRYNCNQNLTKGHAALVYLFFLIASFAGPSSADGVSRMVNLRSERFGPCERIGDLTVGSKCYTLSIDSLKIKFVPITGNYGLTSIEVRDSVDFLEVSTGRLFFFGSSSGGVAPGSIDGDISIRNIFCIEVIGGFRGYAWDGGNYVINDEAASFCPLKEEINE